MANIYVTHMKPVGGDRLELPLNPPVKILYRFWYVVADLPNRRHVTEIEVDVSGPDTYAEVYVAARDAVIDALQRGFVKDEPNNPAPVINNVTIGQPPAP